MKKVSQYRKIIQEIAQQVQKSPEIVHTIIQQYFTNLSTQINLGVHYNIYVQNIGMFELSPTKIKENIKYAIRDDNQKKVLTLESALQIAKLKIQERIQRHKESMKINKEKFKFKENESKNI